MFSQRLDCRLCTFNALYYPVRLLSGDLPTGDFDVLAYQSLRERERERERERDIQTDRQTDRQTDTDIQTEAETEISGSCRRKCKTVKIKLRV